MSAALSRLERQCRRLLRVYPAAWRRRHEDEMASMLLDQAEAEHRTHLNAGTTLDLVGHGLEERLDSLVRWIPDRLRTQISMAALVVGAALGLILLIGEVLGARARPPAADIHDFGPYFISGPFLTIGVGLYLAFMGAALLTVRGHGGPARLLLVAALGYTVWMHSPIWAGQYPTPRVLVLALFAGLAVLGSSATIRPTRPAARGMLGYGAMLTLAIAVGLIASKPVLGWSVGTMSTSGNVAFAALAAVLPVVTLIAVVTAAARSSRHPGWAAAVAIATFPIVVFCTIASQIVNPYQATERAFYPLYYLLVVVTVALAHRRRQRGRLTVT